SGENAFLIATIFTSRLSVPKISTVPEIARSENVPEGSRGNLLSTTSSSTSPAETELATIELTKAKTTVSATLFITHMYPSSRAKSTDRGVNFKVAHRDVSTVLDMTRQSSRRAAARFVSRRMRF